MIVYYDSYFVTTYIKLNKKKKRKKKKKRQKKKNKKKRKNIKLVNNSLLGFQYLLNLLQ